MFLAGMGRREWACGVKEAFPLGTFFLWIHLVSKRLMSTYYMPGISHPQLVEQHIWYLLLGHGSGTFRGLENCYPVRINWVASGQHISKAQSSYPVGLQCPKMQLEPTCPWLIDHNLGVSVCPYLCVCLSLMLITDPGVSCMLSNHSIPELSFNFLVWSRGSRGYQGWPGTHSSLDCHWTCNLATEASQKLALQARASRITFLKDLWQTWHRSGLQCTSLGSNFDSWPLYSTVNTFVSRGSRKKMHLPRFFPWEASRRKIS